VFLPGKADAVGVHENAAAESAFLLAPQRVAVRASLEIARGDTLDGSIYRFYAAFPIRSNFLVAIEQPLVSAYGDKQLDSGFGDFAVRLRARVHHHERRNLWLAGYLGTGTGDKRYFPYSSEAIEIGAAAAVTDSIGVLDVFASAGVVWVQRIPEELDGLINDYRRVSAGLGLRFSPSLVMRTGGIVQFYSNPDARRDILFAGIGYDWVPTMGVFAEGQAEVGPGGERASEWAATGGFFVRF
jgi:hypothetical protein